MIGRNIKSVEVLKCGFCLVAGWREGLGTQPSWSLEAPEVWNKLLVFSSSIFFYINVIQFILYQNYQTQLYSSNNVEMKWSVYYTNITTLGGVLDI